MMQRYLGADLATVSGRALIEERYWSLRRQVPMIYVMGLVNTSALEMAATGHLKLGPNLPTFILCCALIRIWNWFGSTAARSATHEQMVRRMAQTVWFAAAVCIAVCTRCLYLLQDGDVTSQMAVLLFGGLTAIGVAYGLTALPAAARIPLLLIIGPISIAALYAPHAELAGAAFGLVVVAALTMRILSAHSAHFTDVIHSRSAIAREQELAEKSHKEAVVAATTDFLTNLPNRRAFFAAIEQAVSNSRGSFAVAILDLDRFKFVNDTFGHMIGDQLLHEVARRLLKAVAGQGVVARLGGDEFGLLLHGVRRAQDARSLASDILKHVNGPVILENREFIVSASCGIALSRYREDQSPSRLIADADLALYQAKKNPGSGSALFQIGMEAPRKRRARIEQALQLPGLHSNLSVVFQPIFDLRTGAIIANEALARWTDPELGIIPPSEFVPLAEQLNLIDELNRQLMKMAFDAARQWPDEIRLAFNLSAIQLCSNRSAKSVLQALKSAGLAPERLQVEVTETALLEDFERARLNLTQLRQAGVTIVLDDFGAGYASISYLRELRFDQIKLDGGLVTAAQNNAEGKRLLKAVVGLCELLGVSSVAEHVESKELLELVLELGCTAGQGFWLSEPLTAEALAFSGNKDGKRISGILSQDAA